MKILEIIPQLTSGGAERFVVDLCNSLASDDSNDVTLLLFYPLEGYNFYFNELSKKIKCVTINKSKGFNFNLFVKLYRFIANGNYNVVHTHLRAINYVGPLAFCLSSKVKFFHTIHNDAIVEAGGRLGYIIREKAFSKNRIIPITISESSSKSFNDYYNLPSHLIYNGRNIHDNAQIDTEVKKEIDSLKNTPNSVVFLNIARMDKSKQQLMLCLAIKNLTERGYDVTLLIIGNNADKKILQEIKNLDQKNIHILGEKKNTLEYFKQADCFCLSSAYEGLPITILEALCSGCIPISTPVGGVQDVIIDGQNGFLSKDTSLNSYIDVLLRFMSLSDRDKENMRLRAIESFSPFTMVKCAENYSNLFNSFTKNKS